MGSAVLKGVALGLLIVITLAAASIASSLVSIHADLARIAMEVGR